MFAYIQNLSMYRLMLYYLRVLLAAAVVLSFFHLLPYVWWHILLEMLYLIAFSYAVNFVFAKLRGVQPNYESQFITAEILTLIIGPVNPFGNLLTLGLIAAAAQASKYIFVYKGRHIFNPAASGALFGALVLGTGASWWAGHPYLLPFIILGGILLLNKLRWWHLPLSFLVPYLIYQHSLSLNLIAPVLFFSFVMLIEPQTAPAGRKFRIFYGVIIAVVLVLYQRFLDVSYTLELALLTGNVIGRLMNPKQLIKLQFDHVQDIASHIKAFYFKPMRPFAFRAGQFLEWTLPHPQADNRGIRRWFTITASPTEPYVMLTTKFADKSSTFKQALLKLAPGQELTAVAPDGEFTLPSDTDKKLVFIAGGIGITPFRSMVKNLLDKNESRDIVLLYSVKTEDEIAFKDIWTEAQTKLGIKPIYVVTDKIGYINAEMIKKEVPDWHDRMFYLSGPEPMVEAFEKMLAEMGITDKNVIRDYFPGYTDTHTA